MAKGPKDQAVSERLPVARVAVDVSLAHLDRPFDYLVPARLDADAVPGCRVRVQVRRPAGRRLRAGAGRDQRAPGQAGPAGAGDLARARAHPGDLRPGPGGGRPVRGHAGRRAPAGHPAAACHRRTGGPGGRNPDRRNPDRRDRACRRRQAGPAPAPPDPGSWSRYPPGRRSWPAWRTAARSGPPGRPSLARHTSARNGPPRSPSPRPPRRRPAAGWSSWCRTPATWTAWTRP